MSDSKIFKNKLLSNTEKGFKSKINNDLNILENDSIVKKKEGNFEKSKKE